MKRDEDMWDPLQIDQSNEIAKPFQKPMTPVSQRQEGNISDREPPMADTNKKELAQPEY